MFRVLALYPNTPGSRFDAGYYRDEHTPLAHRLLGPHGLRAIRTVVGTAALDGATPPFWAVSEMVFDDCVAFDAAMAVNGTALFADVANYTDAAPVLQLGELWD